MTKEELVLQISKAMHKGNSKLESFNSYQCIKGYFLALEIEELIGIASYYGIQDIAIESK
tara:strand:- start:76 stop:255 length:180 start_codon:yes stop_codon:yes gene_type:complete